MTESFLDKLRPQPTPRVVNGTPRPAGAWAATALDAEAARVHRAPEGQRNHTLNTAAFNLGQLIPTGHLTEEQVIDALTAAANACGLNPSETRATIRSGITSGARHPRNPPERPAEPPTVAAIPEGTDEQERTTWWPQDANGPVQPEPLPEWLRRDDGHALFYPAKVNGLIGESESGKTWVALAAVREALTAGHPVLYLDFEDTRTGIVDRLTALGCTDLTNLHYADPSESLHPGAQLDLSEALTTLRPPLVIIDGFNAAMTLLGLDLNSNTDATSFAQRLLRPIAATGACVIYVDHLPKNTEHQGKGGIGAQAKRAMTTGCAIRVDVIKEFGKGLIGELKLTIDKDRAGHVRGNSPGAKAAGTVTIDSTTGTHIDLTIHAAETDQRPTILMNRVLEHLALIAAPVSQRTIEKEVSGRAETVRWACKVLLEEGAIEATAGPRGSLMYQLVPTASTASHRVPDAVQTTASPGPLRGTRVDAVRTTSDTDNDGTQSDDEPVPWWNR